MPEESAGLDQDSNVERVPDAIVERKRRPALSRVVYSLFGWGLLFTVGVAALLFWGWSIFTAAGPLTAEKTISFPDGASRTEIAALLQSEGVITDTRVMNGASLLFGLRGLSLKPGEYSFQPGVSMATVLDKIAYGRTVTYKLTIPEGWTSQMALARINGNEVLTGDALPAALVPEGALVADTMVFRRGMTRRKLVEDMMAAQAKLVDEIWSRRPSDSPLRSKEELVTLASIVEKETGISAERPRVAAVFLNRLKQGMRLQSDPTIVYGIVGGQGKLDRPISRADIDSKTAYNTYQIDGLPPGPIATPGRAALEAVIAPAPSDDLFFVADGSGGHAFAKTLEEHNANVAKWRDLQKSGNMLPEAAQGADVAAIGEEGVSSAPIVQPELPAPSVPVTSAAQTQQSAEDPAVTEAIENQAAVQQVPSPIGAESASKQGQAQQSAQVETSQSSPASATPADSPENVKFVPGTVVQFGDRKVPVPMIKAKRP
jgi:UPF0755 protein